MIGVYGLPPGGGAKNRRVANRIGNRYKHEYLYLLLPLSTLTDSLPCLPKTQIFRGWENYPGTHTRVLKIFAVGRAAAAYKLLQKKGFVGSPNHLISPQVPPRLFVTQFFRCALIEDCTYSTRAVLVQYRNVSVWRMLVPCRYSPFPESLA